ncbi:MAG: hypothetical protein ACK5QW_03130 [Cyanobacteriota bacterium]|jgi:hypothetical protein
MVKSAPIAETTGARSQESPVTRPRAQGLPASATAEVASSPLAQLQSLVASSPRVAQLKGVGGWLSGSKDKRMEWLDQQIPWLETDLAQALATPEQDRDEQAKSAIKQMEQRLQTLKDERQQIVDSRKPA